MERRPLETVKEIRRDTKQTFNTVMFRDVQGAKNGVERKVNTNIIHSFQLKLNKLLFAH